MRTFFLLVGLVLASSSAQAFVVEDETETATELKCPHLEKSRSASEYLRCSYNISVTQVRGGNAHGASKKCAP